ncbi:alkanesulfonate monooxygenase SsuD/methylene tetrahydromethanopterin reductase-like flavin-dependent oxidoreductase (luciferase family) [Streptomyces sp. V3I8]|uniref:LLM class flavin-dependent oxidoreductase n=1 Tax=Streptomyces sp. V3I8 TaxID=3042279 RepID=UPI00278A58A8|nr:LLM class flavin-dependent oxidoreductase [Streptomyces sp. V3I8]MDQ1041656.1 alkanesulfonate monooxygenase SsuD/methylene tetrahydromethanopterin reductase-like flavin-dependent oxidoreductase (luciferase family) [Streptomyces sp. V3I8]
MEIGVCLPAGVPGADGGQLVEYARRADQLGFSSLTVTDRVVYDCYDSIVALAAAAAATTRVRLVTAILLPAARPGTAVLAKQLASLDRLSHGRLVVGLGSGMREDDYTATGAGFGDRGRRLDAMIEEMRAIWRGDGPVPGIGPRPVADDIPLWGGGHSPAALRRAAAHTIGWISPGGPPQRVAGQVCAFRELWAEQGRSGTPRIGLNCYAALGPHAAEQAEPYLLDYYAYMGPLAGRLASGAITEPKALRAAAEAYDAAGCDELFVLPVTADPEQLDLIAKAVLH